MPNTKTQNVSVYAWQDLATANLLNSMSAVDISTAYSRILLMPFWQAGRQSGTNFTLGWPNLRIELSPLSSGNNLWIPLPPLIMRAGSSVAKTTLNGAVSAAATSCVVTSGTGFASGDFLFLGDASASNYEIVRIKTVSGTTLNFEEACTNGHSNGATASNQAEEYFPTFDVTGYTRFRMIVDNNNGGQTVSTQLGYNILYIP